ncbi:MAG: 30S ribosome-binding factor RbfA [Myxococcales bacterium FL481]|nr:MAG: 30S ribosome-binding factor RbfA [Myxococcales bacterium FL481]
MPSVSRRTQRVEQLLRRELASIAVSGELRDPRLAGGMGFAVTDVRVTPDLAYARVFVEIVASDGGGEAIIAALQASASTIRSSLAGRVQMRRVPQLRFEADLTMAHAGRIDRILEELRVEDSARSPGIEGSGGVEAGDGNRPEPDDGAT